MSFRGPRRPVPSPHWLDWIVFAVVALAASGALMLLLTHACTSGG